MKQLIKLLMVGLVIAGSVGFSGRAQAQNPQDFTINNFTADYYLDRNSAKTSTLHTVEKIQVEFPSYDQNHGILRAIPKTYQGHTISLHIASVTDENNQSIHYTTSEDNDNLVLKIGDADTYVHGIKTYVINYDAKNVVAILGDHDEFYWDVNGDQWQQAFNSISANIHISPSLVNSTQNRTVCYAGTSSYNEGSRCNISQPAPEGQGLLISSGAQHLYSGETLTVVAAFNGGTFVLGPEIAQAKRAELISHLAKAGIVLALPAVAFIYLYGRWRKYGRDPKGRGIIIPEYQPPKGLNALTSDYVFRESLNNKAITALVIELAIRKYITIFEIKQKKKLAKDTTGYMLKLVKDPADLSEDEKDVIIMYFSGLKVGSEVNISDLKNELSGPAKSLKSKLGKNLQTAGYFSNNPNSAGGSYYLCGGILVLGGFFFLIYIFPWAGLSAGLAGIVFLFFARYMPARSQQGTDVHDHMLGLRDYIKLAEADRLKFLQSPQGAEKIEEYGLKPSNPKFKVKLFESLLPYAMIFNLEKDWAKQFEDVYRNPPGWYSGDWQTFNAAYLVSSLGDFNSASAVTFTSPSSSGSSGFGGGGFSGGGGGGGGGGGW